MLGSLRSRLALSNLLITLLALLILTVVFAQLLRQRSLDSAERFTGQEASLVQAHVISEDKLAVRDRSFSVPKLYSFFDSVSGSFYERIIFYSATGACGFDSLGYKPSVPDGSGCAPSSSSWLVGPISSTTPVSTFVTRAGKTYFVSQRSTLRKSAVVLITPGSAILPSATDIAPGFLLAALAAAIIWVLMALFFGITVSRPLAKVAAASRAMAAGDYTQKVDISGGGEIGDLATSFNNMVTQVGASDQLLKNFVADVSHDLRTPLTLISGYAGTILDGTARTRDEVHDAADVIANEAVRMERLVDDLLQLTRLESGLRKFDKLPVSIPDLVNRTLPRVTAITPGRRVENSVSNDLPLARGDEELLERVIMNLLNNALEYTPVDGRVEISAMAKTGLIEVRVADTGVGIREEDQARVFDRFMRMDPSRSRSNGHSGLGLPIVKEIVEAHGGSVWVDSKPGHGSIFTFTVPQYQI